MVNLNKLHWIGHVNRHRVVEITFNLRNLEPLRIGAGKAKAPSELIDLPVLRIHIGGETVPVIPGSSLKGVFRSYMDVFIRSYGGYTCEPFGRSSCMHQLRQRYRNVIDGSIEAGRYDKLTIIYWSGLCLSCKVFGATQYRSRIYFHDLYPSGSYSIGYKTGVAIDRKRGTVARGALYHVEYIEPGAVFPGRITIDTVPNYVMGLIAIAINEINEGRVKIGGFKTRGFGRVRLEDIAIKITPYTELGGVIGGNVIKLPPLDELDEEVVLNITNREGGSAVISGDAVKEAMEKWINIAVKNLNEIIAEHDTRRNIDKIDEELDLLETGG